MEVEETLFWGHCQEEPLEILHKSRFWVIVKADMDRKPVTVIAGVFAKPGMEDEVRQMLLGLLEPSRKDDGCISYHLHEEPEQPGRFWFLEVWASKEQLEAHLAQPHLVGFAAKKDQYLTEMTVTVCSQIG